MEQVAGNAEDEIGERIAAVRESELLYGPDSLLALFGPMIVHICGSPHIYKASRYTFFAIESPNYYYTEQDFANRGYISI